jgi:eukaryotic-like serine/threonine-protein kinase
MVTGLFHGLLNGMIYGMIGGLIGGLGIGSLKKITLVENIGWQYKLFLKRTIFGSISGVIFGLLCALIHGLNHKRRFESEFIIVWITYGLLFGLILGLVSGLVGGFSDKIKAAKASPNQGIRLSLKSSSVPLFVTFFTFGMIFGLIDTHRLIHRFSVGLTAGIIAGSIVGLNRGGSAVIKHYALRLILCLSGNTPFRFIKFLDQCAKLIFLKKIGGGYIFIHRKLLDYFADLPQPTKRGDTEARPIGR